MCLCRIQNEAIVDRYEDVVVMRTNRSYITTTNDIHDVHLIMP